MGGNYKISRDRVEIIKTVILRDDQLKVKKGRILQYANQTVVALPVWKKSSRPSLPKYRSEFRKTRPCTYKTGVSVDL